ncbi:MAG TPA: DUF2905 domain-containing protein [Thermodesulfobacteriota bacterium]
MEIQSLGKIIMITGIFLVVLGSLILLSPKIPFIGRLPGDILIKRDSFTFFFPLASSIIISLIITIILNLILRKR